MPRLVHRPPACAQMARLVEGFASGLREFPSGICRDPPLIHNRINFVGRWEYPPDTDSAQRIETQVVASTGVPRSSCGADRAATIPIGQTRSPPGVTEIVDGSANHQLSVCPRSARAAEALNHSALLKKSSHEPSCPRIALKTRSRANSVTGSSCGI